MSEAKGAAASGFVRCDSCERLWPTLDPAKGDQASCRRCGAALAQRKPNSLARCWALLIAAVICYVPANLFPVMVVSGPGGSEADTIISGVIAMYAADWYVIGTLIFFASITVPILKIVCLFGLLVSVQRHSHWNPRDRTRLYRVVEIVGRWSMLDMFVVSLTVALVQLGVVATVEPGIGASFFAAVVVLTMFAASSFDPRLIWDAMEENE